ncbi:MAG: orotate phosphoribosyltransferase [Gammaproteobacteria bacterium]|nr:MAG: orotate phosphoribosyltransferase [Gammaproteobacteria bacterium]
MLEDYQRKFIELALSEQVLQFGEFTLKSGRISPYFFNAGRFNTGRSLAVLGSCYANAIVHKCPDFDILFGPAYKGIPLVAAAAIALAGEFDRDVPYCFNRKEAKTHGEGGALVGSPLRGRVLVIDDVITAGTAIKEVLKIVAVEGAQVSGIVVGLDRKERGQGELSAIQEIEANNGISVTSITDIDDILVYLRETGLHDDVLVRIEKYQTEFGI